ncbi:hypothetical protein H9Q69_003697 [Fusarium xylarioides]|nr:hypothetical protein H9Q69_003697 [Fusarium xylarioides]
MDPFNDLPAEMRLEVLLSVRFKESINSLIRASPTLFQSYVSFKAQILPSLVAADLDDELVQHAVAIVQFPKSMRVGKEHLAAWDNRQLPNPFQGHYPEVFEEINKLHSLILRLMQDYITKATSRFPPREYLCVPNIYAFSADGHSVFRGQKITTMVRTDILTDNERRSFLKAFLLFELNCKVVKSGLGFRVQPRHGIAYEVPKVLVPLRGDDALWCIEPLSK